MTVRLTLAHLLAERVGGAAEIELEGATVGEALRSLTTRFPSLAALVWTPEGEFNDQLVLFCNGEDIRRLRGLETSITPGDGLMLITAIEGG